jgi:hypothetical protein
MANTKRPELSSVFDDMLSKTRKSFDELYSGRQFPDGPLAAGAKSVLGRPRTGTSPSVSSQIDADSPAARRLNERLGNDWRYEVVEQKRDGDEAIVLCKLIFGKDGAVRTQFGRAQIQRAPVAGASGGVRFQVGSTNAPDEREAFRRATEAALMHCSELI